MRGAASCERQQRHGMSPRALPAAAHVPLKGALPVRDLAQTHLRCHQAPAAAQAERAAACPGALTGCTYC